MTNTTNTGSNHKAQNRQMRVTKPKERSRRNWFVRRAVPKRTPVPSTVFVAKKTASMVVEIWPQMVGSTALLALFTLLFVSSSTASFNFQELHEVVNQYGLTASEVPNAILTQLGTIANVTPAANTPASVYQMVIFVLFSLAFIWAFRSYHAGEKSFTTKDMFYKSTASLTQFILVLASLTIALIPLLLSLFLYQTLISGLIAVSGLQRTAVYVVCGLLSYVSIRFLTGWGFGLYISGLPGMTPIPALKYGTKMVFGRRLIVLRKIVLFSLVLLTVLCLVLLPSVLWAPALAPWLFFICSILALPAFHAFAYTLYRELIA